VGGSSAAGRLGSWLSQTGGGDAPGNVLLTSALTNLPQDSVANASQVITIDKALLIERIGKLSRTKLELVLSGLDAVLGR
jgi:mRNA interferase MazF